jgi:hypothetical protein
LFARKSLCCACFPTFSSKTSKSVGEQRSRKFIARDQLMKAGFSLAVRDCCLLPFHAISCLYSNC